MKALDKYLQAVRIGKAKRYINKGDTVLDIGSVDGVMFERWKGYISKGIGVDPTLNEIVKTDFYELYPGYFPEACPTGMRFNAITLLAVLEHIPTNQQKILAENCGQKYEIELGFWYGTGYVSYGISVGLFITIAVLFAVFYGFSYKNNSIFIFLGLAIGLMVLLQPFIMRYSRVIWLSVFVKYKSSEKIERAK